jgi:hypothetical protein
MHLLFSKGFCGLLFEVCQGEWLYLVRGHLGTVEKGTKDQLQMQPAQGMAIFFQLESY